MSFIILPLLSDESNRDRSCRQIDREQAICRMNGITLPLYRYYFGTFFVIFDKVLSMQRTEHERSPRPCGRQVYSTIYDLDIGTVKEQGVSGFAGLYAQVLRV
jgi:hypothetical protein